MKEPTASDDVEAPSPLENSRLQLLWDVLLFQFKLVADGLRDVLLSPISLISALIGLLAGGDQPDRYFRQVLRLGRRSEIWINLFGHRKHSGTSDDLIAPIKDKVFAEAKSNPWMHKVGSDLNRKLDDVNSSMSARSDEPKSDKSEPL